MHLLADFFGVAKDKLSCAASIESLLREGAANTGATVLFDHFHTFGIGQGITGVLLLAESHISIHTWPEDGFAAADIFMCGNAEPQHALAVLQRALQPASCKVQGATYCAGHGGDLNPSRRRIG
jgi:S-adenosylmethionine decarboxylase